MSVVLKSEGERSSESPGADDGKPEFTSGFSLGHAFFVVRPRYFAGPETLRYYAETAL